MPVQLDELLAELVLRVQVDQRHARLMRLAHLHRAVQVHRQHRHALGDQLVEHLLRQAGARLELVDHDAFHLQLLVVVLAQFVDLLQEAVQRLAREAVAVEGDQHAIGSDQRRHGVEVQRRRGVQVDAVVVSRQLAEQFAQLVDLVLLLQLGLQFGQLGRGGDQVQVVEGRLVDVDAALLGQPGGQHLLEEIGDADRQLVAAQPGQVMAGVALGIQVDQQGAVALGGAHGGEVAGDARLADAALLVEHDSPHAGLPILTMTLESMS